MCATKKKFYAFSQNIENFFNYGEKLRIVWKDVNSNFLGCSELLEHETGISIPNIIGLSDKDLIWRDRADQYRKDEEDVLYSEQTKCIYEPAKTLDGELSLLTFKTPMRRSSGLIDGLFQISFILNQTSFPKITKLINKLQILNPGSTPHMLHNMPNQKIMRQLTKREQECVYYLAKRLTYKEIAKELDISARTIEEHIRHIKQKLGCYNLSSILAKVFEKNEHSQLSISENKN